MPARVTAAGNGTRARLNAMLEKITRVSAAGIHHATSFTGGRF